MIRDHQSLGVKELVGIGSRDFINSPIVMTSEQEGKQGKDETTMRVSRQYKILH
jgi:hypothetical protein